MNASALGRTIQIYLADGTPHGLKIASIHGWTGSVLVSNNTNFPSLLARPEMERTGIYIFQGPDPEDSLRLRVYVGEADDLRDRVKQSANERDFWETVAVIGTSDESLTKGHVRYLEARLIQNAAAAGRSIIDNTQRPSPDKRKLPEADKANMERFLAELEGVLPILGFDLLKPMPQPSVKEKPEAAPAEASDAPLARAAQFELRHRSGIKTQAFERDGEFIVMEGSEALKDGGFTTNTYQELKADLIAQGMLTPSAETENHRFTKDWAFSSPSAAAAVALGRNSNGRIEWRVIGSPKTYAEWQEGQAEAKTAADQQA
ncbi:GIY-YIG nuclease family protein [Neomegalonema sp.]|uniref:GIY-YIG nuclease family protein n=1 Tax=Neomegalonema sp. TaxID=2039713 RepID=UPI0026263DDC|nr:GIY-YIG nuclease family protein [Neomegalonema sp.]MDD2868884.1 GIY-YIG nuclease family protein [Neomegalonema sp.]